MKQTSLSAYRELIDSGKLGEEQQRVLAYLSEHGGHTGSELDLLMRTTSAHKRVSELEAMGALDSSIVRKCRVTGRDAIEWRVAQHPVIRELPKANVPMPSRMAVARAITEILELAKEKEQNTPGWAMSHHLNNVLLWLCQRGEKMRGGK